jgi:CubicO group peptidase (beta-lactamase class C family)
MSTLEILGHCDEKFAPVRSAFEKNFTDGLELGASYAVSVEGEMVVDLWGGSASVDKTKPWLEDTIAPVASSSKIPVSLCGLLLVDRGLIDLDEPVATYWPGFAQNGKESLLVRHIFSHSSGLPGLDNTPDLKVLADWDEVVRRLTVQKPWSEPGTKSAYHSFTFGHLLGELVRLTTGKQIAEFFTDEIARPLGIDFHFGLANSPSSRVAEIEQNFEFPTSALTMSQEQQLAYRRSTYYRVMGYLAEDRVSMAVSGPWASNAPAGNGIGNARSLAQIGSVLARGGLGADKRFFSQETGRLPYEEQSYRFDSVMYDNVRWGLGFAITSKEIPLPFPNAFHWGGAGGSGAVMVPEHGASWAYVPNRFSSQGGGGDKRADNIANEVIKCLQER